MMIFSILSSLFQVCAEKGGWLAEILSPEENFSVISAFMVPYNETTQTGWTYWIGLTDPAGDQQFVWQHSSKPLVWSNWGWVGDEHCVGYLWYGVEADYKWITESCDTAGNPQFPTAALCQYDQVS